MNIESLRKILNVIEQELLLNTEKQIKHAIRQDGQYTHNMITVSLRCLAESVSYAAANSLIDKYNLSAEYDIDKEFPDRQKLKIKFDK